jgi:uncharacterized C2H2 Zn-finger protein
MSEQPQPQEQKPEEPTLGLPNVLDQLKGAGPKPTPSEIALLLAQIQAWDSERYRRWKDEQDEKWRRWKEEQEEKKKEKEKPQNQNFTEFFEKLMERIEALEKRLAEGEVKKKELEMPDWAKAVQEEVQAIRQRFKEEEQKERDRKLIEEHQRPLLEKLKEAEARYTQLEKTLEEMKKMPLTPQQSASINTTLKQIKETLTDIRETGKLLGLKEPEESSSKSSDYGGIPVKGEIPVWAVAIPKIINDIFESIEKRAAMWLKPSQEPILKIPTPQEAAPPVKVVEIQPNQPLIRMPPPPPSEPTPETPVEAAKTIEMPQPVEVKPAETPQPVEVQKVEIKVEPPKPKEYKCKYCSQTFTKPQQLAAHVRKAHKKEKEEEKRKKQEAQPQTPK